MPPTIAPAVDTRWLRDLLYPYQWDFVADPSRFVVWVASRQIGKSFTVAWKALLRALSQPRRHQTIISASKDQAVEIIAKIALHVELCERYMGESLLKHEPTKMGLTLSNGSKIRALAANPRTARGYSGDIYIDEFAHVLRDKKLWQAVFPIASRAGFTVTVTSTPLGDSGQFYELVHPPDHSDPKHRFKVHNTTITEAIRQGLDMDASLLRSQFDSDTYAQEYECAFLGHAESYFPWDLLRSCLIDSDDDGKEDARWTNAPVFLGIDVGRKKDVTSIVTVRRWPGRQLWADDVQVLEKMKFDDQRVVISRQIRELNAERVCIDSTGLGAHLAESLQTEFGSLVQPVVFTRNVKSHLATQVRKSLEEGSLRLTPDGALLADCHAIKRAQTATGAMTYDADRNEHGHADRFWGLALGTEAARTDAAWGFDMATGGGADVDSWYAADSIIGPEVGSYMRAPTSEEFGFEVITEEDIEDARAELIGSTRPPPGRAAGPFQGQIPPRCLLPRSLLAQLVTRGEDPCGGCDADRATCGGRPANANYRRPMADLEPAPSAVPRVVQRDTVRDVMIEQGHVPPACTLDGNAVWRIVGVGQVPCDSCTASRAICGGGPYRGASA